MIEFDKLKIGDKLKYKDNEERETIVALTPPCVVFTEDVKEDIYTRSIKELNYNNNWQHEPQEEKWKPKDGEKYLYVDTFLDVEEDSFSATYDDEGRIRDDANVFPDTPEGKEQAEKCAAEIREVFKKYQS